MTRKTRGFSLLEVSMVLVIIALLAGGIIIGRDMIRGAQVQSVIGDVTKYTQAVQNFRDKYHAQPGDFTGAEAIWGTVSGGCPNGAGTGMQTCNGNGNGQLDTFAESLRAWQQLANAGMIGGSYSGVQGTAYSLAIGTNVPASKVPGCGWALGYLPTASISPILVKTGSYMALVGGGLDQHYPPCLTPAESYSIDAKIDDGNPDTGNIIDGVAPYVAGLYSSFFFFDNGMLLRSRNRHCNNGSSYNFSNTAISCTPFFNIGF